MTAIAAGVPEDSATLQLAPFSIRPTFDNSTRFQNKKNYIDEDVPIVTRFKNFFEVTTYHIEDKEVFGRSLRSDTSLFRVSCTRDILCSPSLNRGSKCWLYDLLRYRRSTRDKYSSVLLHGCELCWIRVD